VVVAAGVTLSVPLIASAPVQPPLAVQDVAFVLDQVRVELPPEEMVVGLADSVTVGAAGFTVTVAVWVAAAPAAFVTVREYIVVTGGVTLTVCPLVTSMFPGAMTPVPLAKTAVKLEELPVVIAAGLAVKLVMAGAGVI
jgi:hypothetical protein